MTRPHQITEQHLSRRAVAYLRQSSPEQLRENTGSTALQRELPILLQQWGWNPERIVVIDEEAISRDRMAGSGSCSVDNLR